ncbi:aldo/keto reductase [Parasedimentitalea psychrophila]|uniref:Aldo/keto reductase n=1 Tax=Parasedimentitalea psychrophila TaxID=2997337 RepID=A0A9Y2KVF8_9RHOB|nr:aldo/keto reductase [Parasedimentitalea psychrophila]NRB19697.1 aldo/keto reductase [Paracoccaceae bacterium]WIY23891.1 aldo/keto reductase [Parasedimentitalea psychrophila]
MNPFEKRHLGTTSVSLTQLGFGGAGVGELRGPLPEDQAQDTVKEAWESGIRYFDTSPWYGRGLSELRLGHALRSRPRDQFVLSSKVGRLLSLPKDPDTWDRSPWIGGLSFEHRRDYTYDGIMRSYEDSIQRLGTTYIDLLLIHDLDHWHLESDAKVNAYMAQLYTSGYRALRDLKDQKLIGGIGAGINQKGTMQQFMDCVDLDFFLLALVYTLLDHDVLDTEMAAAAERGMGFVIGGVYNSGILATGAVDGAMYNYQPATDGPIKRVRRIEEVCKRHEIPLAAAALQFPLGHPNVASVIPGAISPEQQAQNINAMAHDIPQDFWAELKAENILAEHVPTPNP